MLIKYKSDLMKGERINKLVRTQRGIEIESPVRGTLQSDRWTNEQTLLSSVIHLNISTSSIDFWRIKIPIRHKSGGNRGSEKTKFETVTSYNS